MGRVTEPASATRRRGLRGLKTVGRLFVLEDSFQLDPAPPPPQLVAPALLALASVPAVAAAVFSTASAAVSSLPAARIAALAERANPAEGAALRRYLASGRSIRIRWMTLRVTGLAMMAILVHSASSEAFGIWRLPTALLVSVLIYGIPAEIGRGLAERTAERAAPWMLRGLRPFEYLAWPVAGPIELLARAVAGNVDRPETEQGVAEAEVEIMVNEGEQSGHLPHDQSEMIRNILDFGELTAGNVMIPRTQVTTIRTDTSHGKLLEVVREHGHSRYPVVRDRVDDVVGLLHVKDLLRSLEDRTEVNVEELVRQPVSFVPESQPASTVLRDMRAARQHMVIVIDEFGGMSGVLTLEDLLEEIVGDIQDEYDTDEAPIVDLGDGRLLVNASMPISDLSRYLGVELAGGDYHSLGGFILERLGRVPEKGAVVTESGLEFVVREADERHVEKVEIVRNAPSPDSLAPRSSGRSAA